MLLAAGLLKALGQGGCPTPSFAPAQNFSVGRYPQTVITGDFNRDGKLDLVTSNNNDISVLLGHGTGSFGTATNFSVGSYPYTVATGDFNKDGNPDIAVSVYPNSVSLLLGNGLGGFASAGTFTVVTVPFL